MTGSRTSSRGAAAQAEPTWVTPRSPDRYSDGPIAGALITEFLGRRPSRWQQMALDVGLERLDGPASPYAYDEITAVAGRRCGKTVNTMGVPLFRSLAGEVNLPNGRVLPFRGAHTAQNLVAAKKRFLEDLVEPYRERIPAAVWRHEHKLTRNLANTTLTVNPYGGRANSRRASQIQVYAPTPSSVRGDGLLHVGIDEGLVLGVEDGDALMASARPAMAEYFGFGQIWVTSNVSNRRGYCEWLIKQRNKGRGAVESGRRTGVAYLEFSLPEGADPDDERLWWAHYPALGDGIVGIAQLRRDREELGEAFAAEYLGVWPDTGGAVAGTWVAISEREWAAGQVDVDIPVGAPYALGVEIDPQGRDATVTVAAVVDGVVRCEVLATGPDSRWVRGVLLEQHAKDPARAVVVDDHGPGHSLVLALADDGLPLLPLGGKDFPAAVHEHLEGIRGGVWTHRPDPAVTSAAEHARFTSGWARVWDRMRPVSQSAVVSATLAGWGARHAPEPPRFFVY